MWESRGDGWLGIVFPVSAKLTGGGYIARTPGAAKGSLQYYLVVDTGNWVSGKKVAIAPEWVEKVSWAESTIHVKLPLERIRNSPPFDPETPVNREYETRLYDYYGRLRYWS